MKTFLISVALLLSVVPSALAAKRSDRAVGKAVASSPSEQVDALVFGRLKELGIPPAQPCSDEVFLRRVYLDVIGTLPTAEEARKFLDDQDPKKRSALIDRLLERDEFADYWGMKWSDLLRVKAEFPVNLWPNAAQAYHRWIRTSIKENLPYDKFVREMLTANGSNFRVGQVNFYRAMQNKTPEGIAQTVALTFMGTRADRWPKEQLAGMSVFFSKIGYKATGEWKEEIVSFDPGKAAAQATGDAPADVALKAIFPDGTSVQLTADQDPRAVFADWLISRKNPWFAKNIANRVWSWLLGRGIIHEADDIRPDNPPQNPKLLALLERELEAAHYDLKAIYRIILNSKTYQLSSIPASDHPQAAANFAKYPIRRLEAEVLIDALNQVTGTSESYASPIPEPFTFIPDGLRSIALPDGSITSAFLEQFGRPSRDTGLESERANRSTVDQQLHLLNSSHIQRKIENGPAIQSLLRIASSSSSSKYSKSAKSSKYSKSGKSSKTSSAAAEFQPGDVVKNVYLTILSRYPSQSEMKTIGDYFQTASSKRDAAMDVIWALINSAEFLCRH